MRVCCWRENWKIKAVALLNKEVLITGVGGWGGREGGVLALKQPSCRELVKWKEKATKPGR